MDNTVIRRICKILMFVISGCLCLFAVSMLVASFVAIEEWVYGTLGFAVGVMWIWCVFAHLSRIGVLRDGTREVLAIMVVCLTIQLFLIFLLPSLGQNGMAAAWDSRAALRAIQSGKMCFTHNVRNQYWCNYEIILSALGVVFKPSISVGQILNALCCVAVIYPLFRLSEPIGGRGGARFVAFLVGLSPAIMLYSTMLTGEFLSATLLFYGFYFLSNALRCGESRTAVLPAIISGGLVGLSHLFKSITILYTGALVVVLLLAWLERMESSRAWRLCCIGVVVVVSSLTIRMVGQEALAAVVHEPQLVDASDKSSPLLYELVLGLNVSTDGIYSGDLATKFMGMDEPQRKKFVASVIKRDWRKYPGLMARKFVNLHGSHLRPGGSVSSFTLTFRDWPLVKNGKNITPSWVRPFTDCGTMLFRLVFVLGAIGMFMCRKRSQEFNMPGLFAVLVVLAFAFIEQLIEGHGRYKTAIYPFYFMVVPYACVWFKRDNSVYVHIRELVRRIQVSWRSRLSCKTGDGGMNVAKMSSCGTMGTGSRGTHER